MVASITPADAIEFVSLEQFLSHPRDRTEWVDGKLIEKTGLTIKHGLAQGRLIHH
jgi:Uma2 family endonuclease